MPGRPLRWRRTVRRHAPRPQGIDVDGTGALGGRVNIAASHAHEACRGACREPCRAARELRRDVPWVPGGVLRYHHLRVARGRAACLAHARLRLRRRERRMRRLAVERRLLPHLFDTEALDALPHLRTAVQRLPRLRRSTARARESNAARWWYDERVRTRRDCRARRVASWRPPPAACAPRSCGRSRAGPPFGAARRTPLVTSPATCPVRPWPPACRGSRYLRTAQRDGDLERAGRVRRDGSRGEHHATRGLRFGRRWSDCRCRSRRRASQERHARRSDPASA